MAVVVADQMAVFDDPDWRTDLGLLAESTRVAARHYAADAFLLSSLAERVPSPTGGSQGAVPWQSFLREVAVARGLQEGAALREVQRAELVTTDAAVAREVDRRLHDRLPTMSPERVRKEARRLVELLDADAAADRAAKAAAGRAVRLKPGVDGQASAWLSGPALPMTRCTPR